MKPGPMIHRLPTSQKGPLALFAILALVVLILLVSVWMTLRVQNGVRAYTQGESQWSKGRQQAVNSLELYLHSGEELDWQRYLDGIAIPLADHQARIMLDTPGSDRQAIRAHFIQGRNHPDDTNTMIWLYRWFDWHPQFSRAIDAWASADQAILELSRLADQIRAHHQVGEEMDVPTKQALQQQLHHINNTIVPLEQAFSARIGEAARQVNRALLMFLILIAMALVAIGGYLMWRVTKKTFEAEQRFRQIFEKAPVGIVDVAPDGTWNEANNAMASMLGVAREQLTGARASDFVYSTDQQSRTEDPDEPLAEAQPDSTEYCVKRNDGALIWIQQSLTPLPGLHDHDHPHCLLLAEDITETRRKTRELSHRARHDPLTGLVNRYEFERRLNNSIERTANGDQSGALLYLDLDRFKQINDTCGHPAGDEMLRNVASLIRNCVRKQDTAGRLGGDEFAVLLEACPATTARRIAEKIRDAVSSFKLDWEDHSFQVGISIGVAPFARPDLYVDELLSQADAACYQAKRNGKNQIASTDQK